MSTVYAVLTEYQDIIPGSIQPTPEAAKDIAEKSNKATWDELIKGGTCLAKIEYIEGFRAK